MDSYICANSIRACMGTINIKVNHPLIQNSSYWRKQDQRGINWSFSFIYNPLYLKTG